MALGCGVLAHDCMSFAVVELDVQGWAASAGLQELLPATYFLLSMDTREITRDRHVPPFQEAARKCGRV